MNDELGQVITKISATAITAMMPTISSAIFAYLLSITPSAEAAPTQDKSIKDRNVGRLVLQRLNADFNRFSDHTKQPNKYRIGEDRLDSILKPLGGRKNLLRFLSDTGYDDTSYFIGTPSASLIANQKFSLFERLLDKVNFNEEDKSLIDSFLKAHDKYHNKANLLENAARMAYVMPETLLEKIVNIYEKYADNSSIIATPAILSLPESQIKKLLPKLEKTSLSRISEGLRTTEDVLKAIRKYMTETSLHPDTLYIPGGIENTVCVRKTTREEGKFDPSSPYQQQEANLAKPNSYDSAQRVLHAIFINSCNIISSVYKGVTYRPDAGPNFTQRIQKAIEDKNPTISELAAKRIWNNLEIIDTTKQAIQEELTCESPDTEISQPSATKPIEKAPIQEAKGQQPG